MRREVQDKNQKKGIGIGTGLVIGIAVIYILLGLAKIFLPGFDSIYLIGIAGVILLVIGIVLIVKYFVSGSYRDIGKYGFSIGVLGVIAGVCMLVRASEISVYFSLFLGICILLTSIIKLQNAVDLKGMDQKSWIVFLIIAIAFLAAAVYIVLDPFGTGISQTVYIYDILIADGAVNLVETCYLAMTIRKITKHPSETAGHDALDPSEIADGQEVPQPEEAATADQKLGFKESEQPEEEKETAAGTEDPLETQVDAMLQETTDPSDEEILSIINGHTKKE